VRFALALLLLTGVARAAPPEPSGAHPRILLDANLRAAWKAALQQGRGPVVTAVALCDEDRTRRDHDGALYMGAEWAKMLQACLVAWVATDKPQFLASALKYFTALIDDLDKIGDGKGGDKAASRDAGYPIRNLGPYTAIAYDWLHDAPGMTPELRARARQRWAAWLAWFKEHGYHPRDPGSNYQAGYLLAATLIAIAQGGEAGDSGGALWRYVADELWGKDMATALAPGGVLDGGDWNEGWQYGPLSVAEYALGARVGKAHGLPTDGITTWLGSLLRRHVHALTPADRLWAGGDFDDDHAHMPPQIMPLNAVALGDATPDDKRWAKGEIARLKLTDKDWLVHDALAAIGEPPAPIPRASWPTWYEAAASATLYARSSWDEHAIWFVAQCARTDNLDHRGPNAGNFVLSRGAADLIVDPSPYGSLSTLTSNAPTVLSANLGPKYIPSQGAWGKDIAWRWVTKTAGGVVAARCDYADAFRFQNKASDIEEALRDFVLLQSADGTDASLVVIDRATTGDGGRKMLLRFRVPAKLALDGAGTATATIGDARVTISGGHAPALGQTALKDCFREGTTRGNCDAARLAVTDYRVEIAGPEPRAVHVIAATGAKGGASHAPISGDGWTGVRIQGTRDAVVVWPNRPGEGFAYRAPKGKAVTHVVLDGPASGGRAAVSARPEGDACAVTVAAGGTVPAQPLIVRLDETCGATVDAEESNGVSAEGKRKPAHVKQGVGAGGGCCGGHGLRSGAPVALGFVVAVMLVRRLRRRKQAG
jgi:hypothetical protein